MTSRARLVRGLVPLTAACLALALLAGCGGMSSGEAAAGTETQSTAPGDAQTLNDVTVRGDVGTAPAIGVPAPFGVEELERVVITKGDGPEVAATQRVTVDYVGVNGTDGKVFDSTFERGETATFVLKEGEIIAGFLKGLDGVTVGSRVLVAVPPQDGYGTQGAPAAGIGPTDTLLFVIDVKDAKAVLKRAEGAPVAAKAGLPTVTLDADGKPAITLPGSAPPASLVVQPLIVGGGPKVEKGQVITVHYTGVVWPGGKVFDSSWDRESPAQFTIGEGRLIAGWDTGLVGHPVGSQMLLVVPPDQGYGAAGNANAGITGTDTLVFVVDILDAATAAASR